MLWYVEQGGRLVPQLVLPEAERARLAKLPGGLLQAQSLVALEADKVLNTGYILSGGTLAVSADELANLKRNAYYFEERKVKGGKLYIKGDTVQPGGFMQALRWALDAESISSRSGEFRVLGEDEAATQAASDAFVADIAQSLGEDYHYEEAADRLRYKFKAKKKNNGLRMLVSVVVTVVLAYVAGPVVSSWVSETASAAASAAGASMTAGSAWAANGAANAAVTTFVTGTLSSAAGQYVATGKVDLEAALRSGVTAGFTTGLTRLDVGGTSLDSLAGSSDWADRLIGIGTRSLVTAGIQSAVNGTSFDAALRDALVGDLARVGANEIGTHLTGVERAVAHAALGAISAELRGEDAAAGALGALSSALFAGPIDRALGLTGKEREVAVTALAMLSGGILSDALGHDAVTGANAALNEAANNYLSDKRPNPAGKSEQERFREATLACFGGDQAACAIARDLTTLSNLRDRRITSACGDANSTLCRIAIREAVDAGNVVVFARDGTAIVYPSSTPVLVESPRPGNAFQESVAQGIADMLVMEGLSTGASAILRGLGYVGTRLFSYEARSGLLGQPIGSGVHGSTAAGGTALQSEVRSNIAESETARLSSNFDQFVKIEGQLQESLGIWPPNGGGYSQIPDVTIEVGTKLDRFGFPGGQ